MHSTEPLLVEKASGELVPFSEHQLRQSLLHAGAESEAADRTISQVKNQLYQGIQTKKIYRIAFQLLKKERKAIAARYKLKQGIMELGPSGYPFERFIGELFNHEGYATQIGLLLDGNCVRHEVDVLAKKKEEILIVECKYHNASSYTCDVKVPLYVHSRYKDIADAWPKSQNGKQQISGWLITNTKFTMDALQYGACCGLHLVAWNYPEKNSLKHWIERSGLYPLTCLTTLTRIEKQRLLDKGIILCKDLIRNQALLQGLDIQGHRLRNILNECQSLTLQT